MKFQINHPIEPFVVIQGFGVNGAYYQAHGINIKGHNGLDLQASHGQPVYATHDGTALYEVDANQGHGVVVITDDYYDYVGSDVFGYEGGNALMKTIYWHFCDPIKEPQFASPLSTGGARRVKKGDLLGYADSTGFSTSDHLHFAVKPVVAGKENLFTSGPLIPMNGYSGCIDPTPYFENNIESLKAEKISLLKQALSLAYQLLAKLTNKS